MPTYGSRSSNPFMENLLGGMQVAETVTNMNARNRAMAIEEERTGFLREEANRKAQSNALLQARINELLGAAGSQEAVARNLLPMHEAGEIELDPAQLSTLSGPAKTETGLNIRDVVDSLVLGIPLNQMSTARKEDAETTGQNIENRTAADKLQRTRNIGELVALAATGNAPPEALAKLRGEYAALGIDPKNIIPEAGSPLEKALFNMGLMEAQAKVKKTEAETGHSIAQTGHAQQLTRQSAAETNRINRRTPFEIGLLGAQTTQAKTASQKNLAEAGKAVQDVAESRSRQGKIEAEIKKIGVETQNSEVTMLNSTLETLGKNPTIATMLTPDVAARVGLNFVAARRQGGSIGDALSASFDVLMPKEKKEELINTLIQNKEGVTSLMPKIEQSDTPAMQGEKVAQSQDIIRGIFFEPIRDKVRQELGPRATEEEIAQRTILFLNQRVIPEFNPIRNDKGQFIGFDSQYEKLKKPFDTRSRIKEADKKIVQGAKKAASSISEMISDFFGRGDKVLESQDYYRQQRSKK